MTAARHYQAHCECGSGLPVVRVEGRGATHMPRLRDGRIVAPDNVDGVVGDAPWMDLCKLEQDRTRTCTFWYVPNDGMRSGDAAAPEARLAEAMAPNRVQLGAVAYAPCERSGKFQPCVSHKSAEDT